MTDLGPSGGIAHAFVNSKLTPLLVVASVLLGAMAVLLLPREEEPQIKVPMVDVLVAMPGADAREVEQRVVRPMEFLLWEIPGVEYLYSTAMDGRAMTIVRFQVGEDVERSLVKLNQKLQSNHDRIPHGVSPPLIKARSIDDVPILALTLHSKAHDHLALRRCAAELDTVIKAVPQVAETTLIGGARTRLSVEPDPQRLAAYAIPVEHLLGALAAANRQERSGRLVDRDRAVLIETGAFLETPADIANLVVGVHQGRPIHLRDVASVRDAPAPNDQYVFFGDREGEEPAVTISIAKRPGANAIAVAHAVLAQVEAHRAHLLPREVEVTVTRNYGETAAEKSDELLLHMALAVASVSALILFMLGWRAALVVCIAIPSTLALTLLTLYLTGYTLNRITLFALIFSIGILVDDAIVVVENIARHAGLPEARKRSMAELAVAAVAEVGNPTILATIAVIAAILPMAMVGGLMGPYMRPIPVGASAAMVFSLLVAFIVTPWAALRLLRLDHGHGEEASTDGRIARAYRRLMERLTGRAVWRWGALAGLGGLLLLAMALVPLGAVKVKMLPFDNKSEFQVVLNMPEGTALERTAAVAEDLAEVLRRDLPGLDNYQIHVGTSAPYNFNGLVRHYFLRSGDHVADIQVNLLPRHQRRQQSHDLAKMIRPKLTAIASAAGGRVTVAEVPPGPPVLQTIVAEVYGPSEADRLALAEEVKRVLRDSPGVVDLDWYIEGPQPRRRFIVDKEKAALHGIATGQIAEIVRLAVGGAPAGLLHRPREREDVPIVVELPESAKTSPEALLALTAAGPGGMVPLRELGRFEAGVTAPAIYHKNLLPVTYVVADVAGAVESPVYAIGDLNARLAQVDARRFGGSVAGVQVFNARQPANALAPAIKWDGEWHITIEVFRDMGLAFAGVLVLIYLLMVGWFRSFATPMVVMVVIPFSLLGVLPAHAGWGAFFTATSMIGFMAGAGIVVRNSVILVDFIEMKMAEGEDLVRAAIDAGIVRFRPMLLTALAVVVGAAVILADPIFQGLALSLMAGSLASLLVSPVLIPLLYVLQRRRLG